MSTTMVLTIVGVVLFAICVGVQGMADGGGCGMGILGFLGTLAIAALCIAGFRKGCGGKEEDTSAVVASAETGRGSMEGMSLSGVTKEENVSRGTKEEKLRAFALAEAPAAWETYQTLAAEVELQAKRLEKLQAELVEFGRSPEADDDFRELSRQLQDMRVMRDNVMSRMETAYIAARKCEATPGRQDLDELRRRALQDGIQEAEEASWRFRQMKMAKEGGL